MAVALLPLPEAEAEELLLLLPVTASQICWETVWVAETDISCYLIWEVTLEWSGTYWQYLGCCKSSSSKM